MCLYLIFNCRVSCELLPEAIHSTDIGDPGIFVFKFKMSGVLVLDGFFCVFCFFVFVFVFGVWCLVFRFRTRTMDNGQWKWKWKWKWIMYNVLHSAVFDVRGVWVCVVACLCGACVCVVCERDNRMESGGRGGRVAALLRMWVWVCVSDIFTWTTSVSVSVLLVAACAVSECNVSVWCSFWRWN